MSPTEHVDAPRVLLVDHLDRVMLMHARDPDDPAHHWWELPGGGLDDGESLEQAASARSPRKPGSSSTNSGRRCGSANPAFATATATASTTSSSPPAHPRPSRACPA